MKTRARAWRARVVFGALLGMGLGVGPAWGQATQLRLGADGRWESVGEAPPAGSDGEVLARARTLVAEKKFGAAEKLLTKWMERPGSVRSGEYPGALLLRGDARLGQGDEEDALRDYEEIALRAVGSEEFAIALERELLVAEKYLGGMRRRMAVLLGARADSGVPLAEEIIIRINERLPGSKLAERSLLMLADYYYKERDLKMAEETYDVFVARFPRSEHRARAMQRLVYAGIARSKGPRYDATGLVDAQVRIEQFAREFPREAEAAGLSDAMVARLDESLGEKMLETASFYLKRGDEASARFTLKRLLRKHPQTTAASRGVEMMARKGWIEAPKQEPRGEPPGGTGSKVEGSR